MTSSRSIRSLSATASPRTTSCVPRKPKEERNRQAVEKAEQERRVQDAEHLAAVQKRAAATQKRYTWGFGIVAVGAVLAAMLAGLEWYEAGKATDQARNMLEQAQTTQSLFLADQARRAA